MAAILVQEAFAARYDPGVMEGGARNRDMPIVGCMLASPTIPIGEWVYVAGNGALRYCRVTDTSQPADRARHIRTRRIELDYASAAALCGSTHEPPARCPVLIFRLEE